MRNENGVVLILVFIIMAFLTVVTVAFLYMTSIQTKSSGRELASAKAFWVAEAGLAKARWALTTGAGGQAVGWGETASPFGAGNGTYVVTTVYSDPPANRHVTITSSGYIPNNTSYVAKRSVVESDIPFGGNLSLGATATASSESGAHPASDATDGRSNTKWAASDKDDAWLKLNFGNPITFDQVIINGQNNIDSVTISYSNNDIAYSSVTNLTESPAWTFTFDSVTAQYLRVDMNVGSNKKAEVNELETYDTAKQGLQGQGEFSTLW